MAKEVIVTADKIKNRKKAFLTIRIILLVLILVLFLIFAILKISYSNNNFTVTLDSEKNTKRGLIIYDNLNSRVSQNKLVADSLDNMDNISIDWIPKDIHSSSEGGSHNKDNYIAYTFYVENSGKETINYWYQILIDDVIKGADEAIRVKVYMNDTENLYAKKNLTTKKAEEGTKKFYKNDVVFLKKRASMKPDDVDKMTVVIFIEGDDPDCVNSIIGGEVKMHMEIRQENINK